jgi:arsenate reductase
VKQRVLFVCVGNAVRSQMAEGFARAYGWDVCIPASAGVAPASRIDSNAVRLMGDVGIDIASGFPKHVALMTRLGFDVIVNISGRDMPVEVSVPVVVWDVEDPVGATDDEYRRARDLIQKLTIELIAKLRIEAGPTSAFAQAQPSPASPPAPQAAKKAEHAPPAAAGSVILDRKRRLRRVPSA